jgi:hypothetical protein
MKEKPLPLDFAESVVGYEKYNDSNNMNRIIIYDWAGDCRDKLKELGYEHNQEHMCDGLEFVFIAMEELFNAELNVALIHNEDCILLAVDTKSFTQR